MDIVAPLIKQKQYHQAIKHLNNSINTLYNASDSEIKKSRVSQGLSEVPHNGALFHPDILKFIDIRYRCYVKTDNLDNAIIDAQKMISLLPSGAKGYLRLGQAYEQKGLFAKARKAYVQGYNMAKANPSSGKVFVSEKVLNELNSSLTRVSKLCKIDIALAAPERRTKTIRDNNDDTKLQSQGVIKKRRKIPKDNSFVAIFPYELLVEIFSLLDYSFIVKSCFLVSKTWYQTLAKISPLYQSVWIKKPLTSRAACSFLNFYKNTSPKNNYAPLKSLKIFGILPNDEVYVVRKLKTVPFEIVSISINLHEINLAQLLEMFSSSLGNPFFKLKKLDITISVHGLCEEALLHMFPRLESLQVVFSNGYGAHSSGTVPPCSIDSVKQYLQSQAENCTSFPLKSLKLIAGRNLTKYPRHTIPMASILMSSKLDNLESFTLVGFDCSRIYTTVNSPTFLFNFPKLKLLYLYRCEGLGLGQLLKVFEQSKIQSLDSLTVKENSTKSNDFPLQRPFETPILANITYLDLSTSSIDFHDVLFMLKSVSSSLRTLLLNNMVDIVYPQSVFQPYVGSSQRHCAKFEQLLPLISEIEVLSMASNSSFNDFALGKFKTCLTTHPLKKLKKLDISFNLCSGVGILNFFGYQAPEKKPKAEFSMSSKVRKRSESVKTVDKIGVGSHALPFRLETFIARGIQRVSSSLIDCLVPEFVDEAVVDNAFEIGSNLYEF